jgi:hypothetical protein
VAPRLYDLERHPRPVPAEYQKLIRELCRITALPHAEIFELTNCEAVPPTP